MKYYIISWRDGYYDVIGTSSNIAWARKKVNEMIDFNLQVFGYSDGFHICTKTHEKEYHGCRYTDNSKFCMKTIPGAKIKPDLKNAIDREEKEREKYIAMLNEYNSERVAFPAP